MTRAKEVLLCLFDMTEDDLTGKCRKEPYNICRHILAWFYKYREGMTLHKIGMMLNRDHTTIVNGVKKVNNYLHIRQTNTDIISSIIDLIDLIDDGGDMEIIRNFKRNKTIKINQR